jgi:hypothetical protein
MHMYYKLEIPGLQLKLHNSKIDFQFAEFFISLILQAHLRSNFLYWSWDDDQDLGGITGYVGDLLRIFDDPLAPSVRVFILHCNIVIRAASSHFFLPDLSLFSCIHQVLNHVNWQKDYWITSLSFSV